MKRSKKKSRNDGTSDFELGLALSDDYGNSEALSRLAILEKENKSLEEEIDKLKDCCDERDKLKKQIEELTKQIADLKKSIGAIIKCGDEEKNDEIKRLNEIIRKIIRDKDSERERIIRDKDRIIGEKDNKIQELELYIIELEYEIEKLKDSKNIACKVLNRIYNYYNNGRITSVEFLQNIKNFIEDYCDIELPRDRSSIPIPLPRPSDIPLPIPRYRKPTESSKLGYDAAGGKMGRSYDGSKKRSKKVLKKSPRRSRKLKRSSKKKRN